MGLELDRRGHRIACTIQGRAAWAVSGVAMSLHNVRRCAFIANAGRLLRINEADAPRGIENWKISWVNRHNT